MKNPVLLLFILFTSTLWAQDLSGCGLNDNPDLNSNEAAFLNNYLADRKGDFDFTQKKVLFLSGTTGKNFDTKSRYFNDVKSWDQKNAVVATTLIPLSAEQKIESGGYDVMVIRWCKMITKRRIKKNIEMAANIDTNKVRE
ncbi:hypothetical protein [Flavobacterium akiainvivens]|uniref:hypothetical protein n=1 Tax=Flavobacterium akiainvivens TaxID=1202724 RepID=UPI0006C88718|nr:hypothetical protein [Flavobacterium akiainvivens]SFQ08903.1 hypothetical protein SAMN05444144_10119 [Flavobacterium akiainvivens]